MAILGAMVVENLMVEVIADTARVVTSPQGAILLVRLIKFIQAHIVLHVLGLMRAKLKEVNLLRKNF